MITAALFAEDHMTVGWIVVIAAYTLYCCVERIADAMGKRGRR